MKTFRLWLVQPDRVTLLLLLVGIVAIFQFGPTRVHGANPSVLHLSTTEAIYDRESARLMLTVRVQRDDFEQALSKFAGKSISTGQPEIMAPVALAYIRKSLTLRTQSQTKNLEWGGMDTDETHLLLYLESPIPEGIYNARLTDRLLQEIFSDEINSITIRVGALKQVLVFGNDTGELAITIRDLQTPKTLP